jgi:hypothetical protein
MNPKHACSVDVYPQNGFLALGAPNGPNLRSSDEGIRWLFLRNRMKRVDWGSWEGINVSAEWN